MTLQPLLKFSNGATPAKNLTLQKALRILTLPPFWNRVDYRPALLALSRGILNKTERQKTLREKLKQSVWGGIHALDSASHVVILLARKRADLLPHSDYLHNVMANVHKIPTEGIQLRRDYFANFGEKEWGFLNDDAATFAWSARQCYIALGNMMTTAAALNIDSCAIEGFNLKETSTPLEKENVLDSHHFGLAVMVGFGFAGEPPKHEKTRTPIEKISTFL